MADIGANEFSFGAGGAKLGDQLFAGIIAAARNDETGAFGREGQRGGGRCRSGRQ